MKPEPWSRNARIWFVLGLVLAFTSIELAARVVGPSGSTRTLLEQHRLALEDRGHQGPLLFVGDSSIGAAIDPELYHAATGETGYSLWLPNATPEIVEQLLVDFAFADRVTQTTTEIVVIGVTARMFNQSVQADRAQYLRQLSETLPWQDRTNPGLFTKMERMAADRLALMRYRAGLRRPTDWVFQNRVDLELTKAGQLTHFFDRSVDDAGPDYESGEREALRDYRVGDNEFAVLERLIERLDRVGIEVIVLHLPVYNPTYDDFFPRGTADQVAFRLRLEQELVSQPARLIDLTELGDQAAMFADGNHLNRQGSARLTELTAERITG